jgi:hypothetical protein
MRAAPLALATLLLLAGCTASKAPGGTSGVEAPVAGATTGLAMPTWAIGDAWTYTIGETKATYVVTADQGSDWLMETDSAERSFQNLRDDVSRLGPQRKSDLAGSQGDDRVVFFQWPLVEGKTWTTPWDHQPLTVVAHVTGTTSHLQGKDRNGTLVYDYSYDSAVGWFRSLTHYSADGKALIDLKLDTHVHNWTGALARWTLKTGVKQAGDILPTGLASSSTYEVPLTATDVWGSMSLSCSNGAASLGTSPFPFATGLAGTDPRGGGVSGQPCASPQTFAGSLGSPKAPAQGGTSETWGYALYASPGATGSYSFEVVVRTLQSVPFP